MPTLFSICAQQRRRGFDPLSLSPALWLDASDASTLYDATTGGSLVAADGAVARWEDKSGNDRHATQGTLASRPLRKTAIQNGRDVVRCDNIDDAMITEANILVPYTIFLVSLQRPETGGIRVIQSRDKNALLSPIRTTNAAFVGGAIRDSSWADSNEWVLSTLKSPTGGNFTLYDKGIDATTTTRASEDWRRIGIARGGFIPNEGSDCDIAEILVYPTALSDTDRQAVESYLAAKWGITLA